MTHEISKSRIPAGPVFALVLITFGAAVDTYQHPSIVGVVGTVILAAITVIGIIGATT